MTIPKPFEKPPHAPCVRCGGPVARDSKLTICPKCTKQIAEESRLSPGNQITPDQLDALLTVYRIKPRTP